MDEGTLECMTADGKTVATHKDITGEVFPYVCFDYSSACKLEGSTSYLPQEAEQVLEGIPAAARMVRRVMQLLSVPLSSTSVDADLRFLAKVIGCVFKHCADVARFLTSSSFETDVLRRCVVHSALCPLLQSACVLGSAVSSTANAFNREMLPVVIDLVVAVQQLADTKPGILDKGKPAVDASKQMVCELSDLIGCVTGMGARAAVTLLTATKSEQDASVLLTPELFSKVSQTPFDGEFADAQLQPVAMLMKPAHFGHPSASADEAEQIVILTMLYHAGLLVDSTGDSVERAAAVENVVSEARSQVRMKMHHGYMVAKTAAAHDLHDDSDASPQERSVALNKVWEEVTAPIVAKCRILLQQTQMVGETTEPSKWVIPAPYELRDDVFERAADQKMNGSPAYDAVRAVRNFVLSEPSAAAVREALVSRALRNSDVTAGLTSMADLLRAGDHLGRQQSSRNVLNLESFATGASLSARRTLLLSFWAEILSGPSISSCSDESVRCAANDLVHQLTEFLSDDHPQALQAQAASALIVLSTGPQPLSTISFVLEETPLLANLEQRWKATDQEDKKPKPEQGEAEEAIVTLFSVLTVQASMPGTPESAIARLLEVASSAVSHASSAAAVGDLDSASESGPLVDITGAWEGEVQQPADPEDEYDEDVPLVRLNLAVTSATEMRITCHHRFPDEMEDEFELVFSSTCKYQISAADCNTGRVFKLDLRELREVSASDTEPTFSLFTLLRVTTDGDLEIVLPVSDEDECFASIDGLFAHMENRPEIDVLGVDEMTSSERGHMTLQLKPTSENTKALLSAAAGAAGSTGYSPLQMLLSSLAAACHCPAFAVATATDQWRQSLMSIADGNQKAAKQVDQRVAALDLLLLSLAPTRDNPEVVVEWLFGLLESTSPESGLFASAAVPSGSLPVRRAALAFLSKLALDEPWRSCIEGRVLASLEKLRDFLHKFRQHRSVPPLPCWPALLALGGSTDEWSSTGLCSGSTACDEVLSDCLATCLAAPVIEDAAEEEDGVAKHSQGLQQLIGMFESLEEPDLAAAIVVHLKAFEEAEAQLQADRLAKEQGPEPEPEPEREPESEPSVKQWLLKQSYASLEPEPEPELEPSPVPGPGLEATVGEVLGRTRTTCESGHRLEEDYREFNVCDRCEREGTLWRCEECDYDLCVDCAGRELRPTSAWSCPNCTFLNSNPAVRCCAACGLALPKPEPEPEPEPEPAEDDGERPPGFAGFALGFRLVRTALVKIALQRRLSISDELAEQVRKIATTLTIAPTATNGTLANALFYCLGGVSAMQTTAAPELPTEVECLDTDGDTVAFKLVKEGERSVLEKWVNDARNKTVQRLTVQVDMEAPGLYDIRDQDGWGGSIASTERQDAKWTQEYLATLKRLCVEAGVQVVGLEDVEVQKQAESTASAGPPADALLWSHMHWANFADIGAHAIAEACDQPHCVAQLVLARHLQNHNIQVAVQKATEELAAAKVRPSTFTVFRAADVVQTPSAATMIATGVDDKSSGSAAENTLRLFQWCEANERQKLKAVPAAHCLDALMVQYARVFAMEMLVPTTPPTVDTLKSFAPLFAGCDGDAPRELFEKGHPHYGVGDKLKTQLKRWVVVESPATKHLMNLRLTVLVIRALLKQASVRQHMEPSLSSHYSKHPDASMESFYASFSANGGVDRVIAISGRVGWMVDAVTFHFESGATKHYGGSGGTVRPKFVLQPGEYLTKVVQKRPRSPEYYGNAFVFTTSQGRTHELAGSRQQDSYSVESGTLTECSRSASNEEITGLVFDAVGGKLTSVVTCDVGRQGPACEDSHRGQPNLSYALYLLQILAETVGSTSKESLSALMEIKGDLYRLIKHAPSEVLVQTLLRVATAQASGRLDSKTHQLLSTQAAAMSLHEVESAGIAKRQALSYSPLLNGLLEALALHLPRRGLLESLPALKGYPSVAQVLMAPNLELPSDAAWYTQQAAQASTSTAAASWCWGAQREMSTTEISEDARAVWKTSDSPDYSVCLGTSAFPTEGIFEWTVQISNQARGIALGVCTALSEAELGRAIWRVPRDGETQTKAAWYIRTQGEIAQLRPGAQYSTTIAETEYEIKAQPGRDTITLRLDCDVGVIRFLKPDGTELGSCGSLDGELFPFVCLDNTTSKCQILSTSCLSEGMVAVVDSSQFDFTAALEPSLWPVEMDSLLIQYACERASKTKSSARYLNPLDLFSKEFEDEDAAKKDELSTTGSEKDEQGSNDPDARSALSRQASRRTVLESPAAKHTEAAVAAIQTPAPMLRLRDRSQNSLRARLVLLQRWTSIVSPMLPLVDFGRAHVPGSLAHNLCLTKGRLFPDVKSKLFLLGCSLTEESGTHVPRILVTVGVDPPNSRPEKASVFEQVRSKLGDRQKNSLRVTQDGGKGVESQYWRVDLSGVGAAAWSDTQDEGGLFRACARDICVELQSTTLPLLVPAPNAALGVEGRDRWLPTPAASAGLSATAREQYQFLGALMGAAARGGTFMELDLAASVWKQLLVRNRQFCAAILKSFYQDRLGTNILGKALKTTGVLCRERL
jgi:hypothetical protein